MKPCAETGELRGHERRKPLTSRGNVLTLIGCLGSALALSGSLLLSSTPADAFSVTGDTWQRDYRGVGCASHSAIFTWTPCYVHFGTSSAVNGISGWQTTAAYAQSQWYANDSTMSNRLVFSYQSDNASVTGDGVNMNATDLGWCSTCSTNTLGYAQWFTSCDPLPFCSDLSYVDIEISTNTNAHWYVEGGGGTQTSSQNSLEENMTHELGHALGLNHASVGPNSGKVMQACQTNGEHQYVANDDFNGELYLYSGHGGYGSPTGNYSC